MDTVIGLRFDGAEDVAIHWAARSGLEHALNLETLEELYERALPYFKAYGYMLTTKHGWVDEGITEIDDMQLALCLGRDEQLYVDDSSAPHVSRLVLPRRFSSFTDPELAQDWAAMFSNLVMTTISNYPDTITEPSDKPEIFQLGRAGIPRPLQNIIYLLQCLSPGLIVVRTTEDDFEEDGFPGPQSVTETGLPPALWVGEHIEDLEFVFGTNLALDLYKTADDPYSSVEEVDSRDGSSDTLSDTSFSSSASSYEEEWSSWDRSEEDMDKAEYEFFAEESDYISHQKEIPQTNYQNKNHFAAEAVEIFDDSANYRHCDSSCSFCGKCSNRFAERLTELLLRTAIVG